MPAENQFTDQVVFITGASRGIGRATARAFARRGARVMLNYHRSEAAAEELAAELSTAGQQAELLPGDVSAGTDVERMVDTIMKLHGRIDVLVNNAGIRKDGFLAMMSERDWDRVLAVNLKSVYHTGKWVSRAMIPRRQGRIINLTSVSALKGVPGQANYAASKGGLISLTRSMASELAPYGILVNAVAPGLIDTEMLDDLGPQKDALLARIPLGRLGTVEEVAAGILFLASADADYITGQTLVMDGGLG